MHSLQNELRKQEHFHSVTLKLVMPTSWVTQILWYKLLIAGLAEAQA